MTGKISFYGSYTEVYTVERAWGLYKGGTLQKILESEKDYQVKGSVFSVKMSTLTFGAGLADGTYQAPSGSTATTRQTTIRCAPPIGTETSCWQTFKETPSHCPVPAMPKEPSRSIK